MYAKDRSTLIDRREMLRIKLLSLVAEAKIIRKEEKRLLFRRPVTVRGREQMRGGNTGPLHFELWQHRTGTVRFHARTTHIAYGLIRGRTIEQMEAPNSVLCRKLTTHTESAQKDQILAEVQRLLMKYGPKSMMLTEVKKAA